MSQFFASGGQSTGASASALTLSMNTQNQKYFSINEKSKTTSNLSTSETLQSHILQETILLNLYWNACFYWQ